MGSRGCALWPVRAPNFVTESHMQAYGASFARVYDRGWSGFARRVAPLIHDFYVATPEGQANRSLVDLGCGTGLLAAHFLERGFSVLGVDLSEDMLRQARENAARFIQSGHAAFIQGDAGDPPVADRAGLVVASYDVLSHLEDERALKRCFEAVLGICEHVFVFDLSTRASLRRWSKVEVTDEGDDAVLIFRGAYDEQGSRAWSHLSGFFRTGSGLYERFEQTIINRAYEMAYVRQALLDAGWNDVHLARVEDLGTPVREPEAEDRVFFVARRHAPAAERSG